MNEIVEKFKQDIKDFMNIRRKNMIVPPYESCRYSGFCPFADNDGLPCYATIKDRPYPFSCNIEGLKAFLFDAMKDDVFVYQVERENVENNITKK